MKKLLLAITVLLMPLVIKAQNLSENQKIMGPYTSDDICDAQASVGVPSSPGSISVATLLPVSDFKGFDGGVVKAIRFGLPVAAEVTEVFLYNDTDEDMTLVAHQDISGTSSTGWTTINLDIPYQLDFTGVNNLILGFTYTQLNTRSGQYYADECYPVSLVAAGSKAYEFLIYADFGEGANWYDEGNSMGNLSIQAIVESNNFPDKDIVVNGLSIDGMFHQPATELEYLISLNNFGIKPIQSCAFNVLLNGTVVSSISNDEEILPDESTEILGSINLPTDLALGQHTLAVRLVEVDGTAPAGDLTNDEATIDFKCYSKSVQRQRQLIEHFTSSSCTYCPLGIQLLDSLSAKRDDLAWVSIHGNMSGKDTHNFSECDDIQTMLGLTSWPSASFNRTFVPDMADTDGQIIYGIGYREQYIPQVVPYISALIDWTAQNPSFVNLAIEQKYNEDTRELTVTVVGTGTDGTSIMLSDAGLNIYLTEDGLMGKQLNQGTWQASFTHNHTLRAVLTPVTGQPIEWDGDNFRMTFTTELDSKWKRDNMHVIAFVAPSPESIYDADTNNMQVNNCEMVDVKDATTDIAPVVTALGSRESIHSVSGTTLSRLQRGINIVRSADGRTQKLLVK